MRDEKINVKNILNFVKELPKDDKCKEYFQNISGKMVLFVKSAEV